MSQAKSSSPHGERLPPSAVESSPREGSLSDCHCSTETTIEADTQTSDALTGTDSSSVRRFHIQGLDCVEEVRILKRAVGSLVNGEEHLAFDTLNGRMSVLVSTEVASDHSIIEAVKGTGMSASSDSQGNTHVAPVSRAPLILTILSGALIVLGGVIHLAGVADAFSVAAIVQDHPGGKTPMIEILVWLAATLAGVRYILPKAWYSLKTLRPDMNLLMIIAVLGAITIGEYFEAATVAFLFALSLLLESWSVGRARKAVSALLDLAPSRVRLVNSDGSEQDVPAASVSVGSRFVVRAGDRIALDGDVVDGAGSVNQAPITGESIPVAKMQGDEVFAGTINGEGTLTVEATKPASDTVLARITRMISDAHERRAPMEQWVERFARIYTPVVMLLALLVLLIPPLLLGAAWQPWIYNALVLLVIACPCALVISTPVSIVASLAASARNGVLIKGGTYVELPAKLQALALDKTGTLTLGEPRVSDVVPLDERDEQALLSDAVALEERSSHPLAAAIVQAANQRSVHHTPADDVVVTAGKGVTGRIQQRQVWLGSLRFATESVAPSNNDAMTRLQTIVTALEAKGRTVVVVGEESGVLGLIALEDTIRSNAKAVITELHALGVQEIVMLTGDNEATAQAVAESVGIDTVRAGLLPEDKVREIEALTSRHPVVAMVGDGVNDAPAMARANFGIAMGAIGSDAAIETADIALMTDELARLPWLIKHARGTLKVIHQNIAFSLGIKAFFVVLTAMGIASLWGAIAADVGATLLVVANALRLLRATPSDETEAPKGSAVSGEQAAAHG